MPAFGGQDPVETLASDGADEPLSYSVCLRRSDWCVDRTDALSVEDRVEGVRELAVVVSDQELQGSFSLGEREVPGLLGCPRTIGVLGQPGEVYSPG